MKAGFTKGPWQVESNRYGSGIARNIYPAGGRFRVANVAGDPRPAAENEANARLIAAAPELYEAAAALIETCQDRVTGVSCIALNMLVDALKKARGEQ